MSSFVISSGHGKYVRGASGYIDEVDEARRVTETVADVLRAAGHEVKTFHDDTSTSQDENLATIVNFHNAQTRDFDVSVHFNAYSTTSKPMGCEVWYYSQQSLAATISEEMATAADLPDRGAKKSTGLYFLNYTEKPAVLLEVCFVDSSTDAEHYNANYDAICKGIADGLAGEELVMPIPPPVEEVPTDENRVDILGHVHGEVAVVINGSLISGHLRCRNIVRMRITMSGDVILSINGQNFHNQPAEPEAPPDEVPSIPNNQKDITTTVFGGVADGEYSAYPPYDSSGRGEYLNDSDLYVALPVNVSDADVRERGVRVFHGELSAVGRILDKGPWLVDDEAYVFGGARPLAETCHDENTPLPRGPNAGKVPSNDAGLDISPALADVIGIDGKGKVSWMFVEDADA